jgi:hypothetical protein
MHLSCDAYSALVWELGLLFQLHQACPQARHYKLSVHSSSCTCMQKQLDNSSICTDTITTDMNPP